MLRYFGFSGAPNPHPHFSTFPAMLPLLISFITENKGNNAYFKNSLPQGSFKTIQRITSARKFNIKLFLTVFFLLDSWPRTRHGLPSTSGTTATVVIFKGRTLYIAHVGDSGAALGRLSKEKKLQAVPLTADHKPDVPSEKNRIESLGGKVLSRNGVPRVAWERPVHHGHKGPVRRSTQTESVPFLAISRALGK